ncbi:MAG: LamG-like jellyroll fold domain-containing protein [Sedimentisphaerales bacterium]
MKRQKNMFILIGCVASLLLAVAAKGDPNLGPFAPTMDTLLLYHMDEASGGTLTDSSDYQRNGTMTAQLLASTPRIVGQTGFDNAVNFVMAVEDRAIRWSDPANALALHGLDGFTIETWIKPTFFSQQGCLFALGATLGSCISVVWDYDTAWGSQPLGRLYVATYAGGWQFQAIDFQVGNRFVINQWQHFRLVYKKTGLSTSTYEIYKNGVLVGSANNSYVIGNAADQVSIGQTVGGVWYRQYEGAIDEFRILDYANDGTYTPPVPQTVALYRFDTMYDDDDAPYGEYVTDDSGNNLHLKRDEQFGNFQPSQDVPSVAPAGSLSLDSMTHTDTPSTDLLSLGRNGELTIEFWYKTQNCAAAKAILQQEGDTGSWYVWQTDGDGTSCAIEFEGMSTAGERRIKTGNIFSISEEWSHVAIRVRRSGIAEIFKNGVLVANGSGFTGFDPYTSILRMGSDIMGNYVGTFYIDDLRITDRALPVGTGSGNGEMAWNTSLSNSPTKKMRPPQMAKQWLRTHPFMISSWGAVGSYNLSDWSQYTAANFNATVGNRSGFQIAINAGVPNHQLDGFSELDGEALKTIQIASNVSNFEGWLLRDEIPPADINSLADVTAYIRTIDPNRIIYAGLGSSGEPYIDNVVNTIKPDVLIHAGYWVANQAVYTPLGIDLMEYRWADLEVCRRKALQYDLPLFYYVQSFADHYSESNSTPVRYLPSESQLRSELFTDLAFGVKGFVYFVFDKANGGPILDAALYDSSTSTPSALYAPAATANSEVLKIGNSLRFLESTDVRFVKGQPANPTPSALTNWSTGAGGDTHIQNIQVVEQGTGKDGIIGFFTDDADQKYFMLTNLYQGQTLNAAAATLHFNVTFDSSVNTIWRLRRDTGVAEAIALTGHVLALTLPGGTGDLFKYDNGSFQTSGCADSSNAYPTGDLNGDCSVTLEDYAVMASNWFNTTCSNTYWCQGADISMSSKVDMVDLAELTSHWLE